jgi:hypothetical protein
VFQLADSYCSSSGLSCSVSCTQRKPIPYWESGA